MKVIFAVSLVLSCLTGFLLASDAEQAAKIVDTCMADNGVTAQDLTDLRSGKLKPEDAKDNIKCATQCVFVKFGFMDDKGKLLTDQILAYFPDATLKSKVETAIGQCANVVGANPCDTAFQMMSCFEKYATHAMSL